MSRLLFALCALCVSLPLAAEPPITAESPWVREAPPGTAVTAAYLTLHNRDTDSVVLNDVSADEFGRAEMHESVHEAGEVRMRPLSSLAIPPEGQVRLVPGGKHIMLHEPRRELSAGDWVTLTLRFDNGQILQLAAQVRQRTGREDDENHELPGAAR